MSLSIPFAPQTCQIHASAPLRRRRARQGIGMTKPKIPASKAAEPTPAQLATLLVTVGRDRDVEAFEALFRFYAPKIRAFMALKTKDRQAAEELMQETMMAVWSKSAQFDPARGTVSAWVFTVARNIRIDAYRRKQPMFDPQDPAFVADDIPPADSEFEQAQEADLLRRALSTLPSEQQDVLKKAFFEDIPHSAIAQQMNLPLGTVKSRIRLAFAKLRTALEDRR